MNTNANEPAHPFTPTDKSGQIGPSAPGLTKREAAAIAAMQGMMSARMGAKSTAMEAVLYADALLLELSKPQTP